MLKAALYGAAPSTPPAGYRLIFAMADGWYSRDDAGAIVKLEAPPLPLSIPNGGTGQTSAAAARAALGAAVLGANGDITSLSGLSTPLSIPQGGTGQVSAAAARAALGAAAAGANSDITSLTGLSTPLSIPQGGTGQIAANAALNALLPAQASNAGRMLQTDGTNTTWALSTGISPASKLEILDDFISGNEDADEIGLLGWRNTFGGTGNSITRLAGEAGRPGILRLVCGTTATSRQIIHLADSGVAPILKGSGEIVVEALCRLTMASLATHARSEIGLSDVAVTAAGEQNNGIYFQILGADSNWFLVGGSGGARTRIDTGIAYSSGAWVKFKFTINAAGTSVQANINGTNVGSALTTNLPTVAVGPFMKTDGIAGGVSSAWDIDYYWLTQVFTTPR